MRAKLLLESAHSVLRSLPDNSIDAIVTDPPYELSKDGKHGAARVAAEMLFRDCDAGHPQECWLNVLIRAVVNLCDPGRDGCSSHLGSFAFSVDDRDLAIDALFESGVGYFGHAIGMGLGMPTSVMSALLGGEVGQSVDGAVANEIQASGGEEGRTLPCLRLVAADAQEVLSVCSALKLMAVARLAGARVVRVTEESVASCDRHRLIRVVSRSTKRSVTFTLLARDTRKSGKGFMGHAWDGSKVAFDVGLWREALRVLKPGGHLLSYSATRTYHWLACALELAGFEIRDMIPWLQAQGMPHGQDVSKAIDKMQGAEREVVGVKAEFSRDGYLRTRENSRRLPGYKSGLDHPCDQPVTLPASEASKRWQGWNTTLAPKHEPCVLARKPLSESSVAANVLAWGTGALNIDGCRLEGGKRTPGTVPQPAKRIVYDVRPKEDAEGKSAGHDPNIGRWVPNVTLSEAAAEQLDLWIGCRPTNAGVIKKTHSAMGYGGGRGSSRVVRAFKGGPSQFFYVGKARTGEREQGCEGLRWTREGSANFRPWREGDELLVDGQGKPIGNPHPTVKPIALMRHLVRLVTPSAGVVLDPFMGSGTTGIAALMEGFWFIGCDSTPWAFKIAEVRIHHVERQLAGSAVEMFGV